MKLKLCVIGGSEVWFVFDMVNWCLILRLGFVMWVMWSVFGKLFFCSLKKVNFLMGFGVWVEGYKVEEDFVLGWFEGLLDVGLLVWNCGCVFYLVVMN